MLREEEELNGEIERQTSEVNELTLLEKSINRQQETQKKDYESNLNSLSEIFEKKSKEVLAKKSKENEELVELLKRNG